MIHIRMTPEMALELCEIIAASGEETWGKVAIDMAYNAYRYMEDRPEKYGELEEEPQDFVDNYETLFTIENDEVTIQDRPKVIPKRR